MKEIQKTRADHACFLCDGLIPKGSPAHFEEGRDPAFNGENSYAQTGIFYWKVWFHRAPPCVEQTCKEEEHQWREEYDSDGEPTGNQVCFVCGSSNIPAWEDV